MLDRPEASPPPTRCLPIASPAARISSPRSASPRADRARHRGAALRFHRARRQRRRVRQHDFLLQRRRPGRRRRPSAPARRRAPALLIGHSLGGAAVLAARRKDPRGARGRHHRGAVRPRPRRRICSRTSIDGHPHARARSRWRSPAGRSASGASFWTTSPSSSLTTRSRRCARRCWCCIRRPTTIVGIENASAIFTAARHPKSFVSLAGADHLLSRRRDAVYVADVIAAWAERYLERGRPPSRRPSERARARSWSRETARANSSRRSVGPHRAARRRAGLGRRPRQRARPL